MKEICRQNRCRMIFIWHCWLRENRLVRHEDYEPIRPYLDLFRLYAAQGKEPGPWFADFCHPSPKGHVLISRKLEEMIVNGGG
jgi:lysophospholipase L1-like esterase